MTNPRPTTIKGGVLTWTPVPRVGDLIVVEDTSDDVPDIVSVHRVTGLSQKGIGVSVHTNRGTYDLTHVIWGPARPGTFGRSESISSGKPHMLLATSLYYGAYEYGSEGYLQFDVDPNTGNMIKYRNNYRNSVVVMTPYGPIYGYVTQIHVNNRSLAFEVLADTVRTVFEDEVLGKCRPGHVYARGDVIQVKRLHRVLYVPTEAGVALVKQHGPVTDVKDIVWGSDDVDQWHVRAFGNADDMIKLAVKNAEPPPLTMTHEHVHTGFQKQEVSCYLPIEDFPDLPRISLVQKDPVVWAHEVGHHLDHVHGLSNAHSFKTAFSADKFELMRTGFTGEDGRNVRHIDALSEVKVMRNHLFIDGLVAFFKEKGVNPWTLKDVSLRKTMDLRSTYFKMRDAPESERPDVLVNDTGVNILVRLREAMQRGFVRPIAEIVLDKLRGEDALWVCLNDLVGCTTMLSLGGGHDMAYLAGKRRDGRTPARSETFAQCFTLLAHTDSESFKWASFVCPNQMRVAKTLINKASRGKTYD